MAWYKNQIVKKMIDKVAIKNATTSGIVYQQTKYDNQWLIA